MGLFNQDLIIKVLIVLAIWGEQQLRSSRMWY
jgi:hypothetical protein